MFEPSEEIQEKSEEQEMMDGFLECARYGEIEDLKECIAERPDLVDGARDERGNTALHMAAANGHAEASRVLISQPGDAKARVNARNANGSTALHWAAMNDKPEVVKVLLEMGADPMIKTAAGKTALYEAQQRGAERIAVMLLAVMSDADVAPPNATVTVEEDGATTVHAPAPAQPEKRLDGK